jgi:hypothetical protein
MSLTSRISGFSLIQLSVLLIIASLTMVAILPSTQAPVVRTGNSADKMSSIITALRQYQAATCSLPCPADPLLATDANNYGVASTQTGTTNNCVTGGIYADTTKHIALGMVPWRTLGLSYDYALDAWGRDITYAVDTGATSQSAGTSTISVTDNGNSVNSVVALVSHGQDGFGAWLPLAGSSGTASRLNTGSTDASQAANAQVTSDGNMTNLSSFVSFVNKPFTSTFDDTVIYNSPLWNINNMPAPLKASISPPANGTYGPGNTLTFTITSASTVTITSTPRLALSAISGGSIGTGNVAYANYVSGSGTTTLTFTYTVQAGDTAPNGLTMTTPVDLNGGTATVSPCLPFTAPDLSQIIIVSCKTGYSYCRPITIDHTKVPNTDQTNFPLLISGTYSYLATVANGGNVQNANGYDIIFTSDQTGTTTYNFERESYAASSGAVNFWVQIPNVSHTTDTTFYVQYGNVSVVTDQQNAAGTWDSNYKAVYHLNSSLNDSTSNTANLSNHSATSAAAMFANGESFNSGSTAYIYKTTPPMTAIDNFTMSMWAKPNSSTTTYIFLANGPDTTDNTIGNGYSFGCYAASGTQHWIVRYPQGGGGWMTDGHDTGVNCSTSWTYLTLTRTSGTSQMYVNGVAKGSTWATAPRAPANLFSAGGSIWANPYTTNSNWHFNIDGKMDEIRLSTTPRSADWITTEYNNQNSPSTFYTIGSR